MPKSLQCPCCSGKLFQDCCAPFLSQETLPTTALQLMRSRYTAYSLIKIDYIQATMRDIAAQNFDPENAKLWAERAIWCGLKIINPGQQTADRDHDHVEFAARFVEENKLHILQEQSQFTKIDGKWFYVSGQLIPHQPVIIRASDLCPCGRKRKFSQCCGKQKGGSR